MTVAMSGNLHYIIYGVILRLLKIRDDCWFPSSTRYIGFDPVVEGDETIHEIDKGFFGSLGKAVFRQGDTVVVEVSD